MKAADVLVPGGTLVWQYCGLEEPRSAKIGQHCAIRKVALTLPIIGGHRISTPRSWMEHAVETSQGYGPVRQHDIEQIAARLSVMFR